MNQTQTVVVGVAALALLAVGCWYAIFMQTPHHTPPTDTLTSATSTPVTETATSSPTASTTTEETIEAAPETVTVAPTLLPVQPPTPVAPLATDTVSADEDKDTRPPVVVPDTKESAAIDASDHNSILVQEHNIVRAKKNLAAVSWSSTLADSAQAWADNLASRECAFEHSGDPYGENLYMQWTTGGTKTLHPGKAVQSWAAEEADYDYTTNSCAPGAQCGHYTQIVWEDTTAIGCGVSICDANGRFTQIWVCQYDPPGNNGNLPY